ncbi:DUF2071 domain-containing protein [bacterium]|nr:DUF2071 domain-containing protein [bacterium]MCI0605545.1 DUF2071 domain-containing protein [bacterium]
MLFRLKRHPFVMRAHLERTLVLTYALPVECLKKSLPPGLSADTVGDLGFVAIALVQTRDLRPAFLPRCFGQNIFIAGYRIIARYVNASRRSLRGLRIIESYTDKRRLVFFSNLFTHYHYRTVTIQSELSEKTWRIKLSPTPALDVIAELDRPILPNGSPFKNVRHARRYAGPLPFTFDYEGETGSIVTIEGVRKNWNPRPVAVRVIRNTLLEKPPFHLSKPLLASAFYMENVPYLWKKGVIDI